MTPSEIAEVVSSLKMEGEVILVKRGAMDLEAASQIGRILKKPVIVLDSFDDIASLKSECVKCL